MNTSAIAAPEVGSQAILALARRPGRKLSVVGCQLPGCGGWWDETGGQSSGKVRTGAGRNVAAYRSGVVELSYRLSILQLAALQVTTLEERNIMSKNGGVIGVSDHGGWAVLVTVGRGGTRLDRRRGA